MTSLSNVLKHVQTVRPISDVPIQVIPLRVSPAATSNTSEEGPCPEAVVSEILAKTNEMCEQRLAEAQSAAECLLEEAKNKASEIERIAEEQGYQKGLRRGREEAATELAKWKTREQQSLTALSEEIETQRQQQLSALSPVIADFAMAVAQKLLYRELQLAPADVGEMVADLMAYVIQSTSVQVRVHPDDYVQARQAHPRWLLMKYGDWEISIIPDTTLARGDCEILGDNGRVDAKLHTRLEELEQVLDHLMYHQGEAASGAES